MNTIIGKLTAIFWGVFSLLFLTGVFLLGSDFGIPLELTPIPPEKLQTVQYFSIVGMCLLILLVTFIFRITLDKFISKLIEKNNHVKSLLRVVSHDIGNPLSIVIGSVDVLKIKNSEIPKEDIKHLHKIERAAKNIKVILDHVNHKEFMESANALLPLEPVSLEKVIANGLFIFSDKLDSKKVELIVDNASFSGIKVLAEPVTLSNQVINNILSNAVKFSLPGGKIYLKARPKKNSQWVEIEIKDEGIGMPNRIINNLFSTSTSVSRTGTSGEKGLGFGMPLVKRYIEKYGGHIEIESKSVDDHPEEHGSKISVFLKKSA